MKKRSVARLDRTFIIPLTSDGRVQRSLGRLPLESRALFSRLSKLLLATGTAQRASIEVEQAVDGFFQ